MDTELHEGRRVSAAEYGGRRIEFTDPDEAARAERRSDSLFVAYIAATLRSGDLAGGRGPGFSAREHVGKALRLVKEADAQLSGEAEPYGFADIDKPGAITIRLSDDLMEALGREVMAFCTKQSEAFDELFSDQTKAALSRSLRTLLQRNAVLAARDGVDELSNDDADL